MFVVRSDVSALCAFECCRFRLRRLQLGVPRLAVVLCPRNCRRHPQSVLYSTATVTSASCVARSGIYTPCFLPHMRSSQRQHHRTTQPQLPCLPAPFYPLLHTHLLLLLQLPFCLLLMSKASLACGCGMCRPCLLPSLPSLTDCSSCSVQLVMAAGGRHASISRRSGQPAQRLTHQSVIHHPRLPAHQ